MESDRSVQLDAARECYAGRRPRSKELFDRASAARHHTGRDRVVVCDSATTANWHNCQLGGRTVRC